MGKWVSLIWYTLVMFPNSAKLRISHVNYLTSHITFTLRYLLCYLSQVEYECNIKFLTLLHKQLGMKERKKLWFYFNSSQK